MPTAHKKNSSHPIRVGIFAHTIQIGNVGGVQQYTEQIINGLTQSSSLVKVVLFCAKENKNQFVSYIADPTKVDVVVIDSWVPGIKTAYINAVLKEFWLYLDKLHMSWFYKISTWILYKPPLRWAMYICGDYKVWIEKYADVIHFPYPYLNRYDIDIPTIITTHDLQHKVLINNFSEDSIKKRDKYYKSSAKYATRVMVSYQHVKEDIIRFYNIPAEKIDVCREGQKTFEKNVTTALVLPKAYSNLQQYMIYPASPSYHKNHVILLEAMDILRNVYDEHMHLLVTGNKYASDYIHDIEHSMQRLQLEEEVVFTGFVSDSDLRSFMLHAALVIIPTLYESGSLPLDEAMSLEVPVLCSNVTALPEQIKDSRFVFDPHNAGEIAKKIHRIIYDKSFREANIENSRQRKKELAWDVCLPAFERCYEDAYISSPDVYE